MGKLDSILREITRPIPASELNVGWSHAYNDLDLRKENSNAYKKKPKMQRQKTQTTKNAKTC